MKYSYTIQFTLTFYDDDNLYETDRDIDAI